MQQPSRLAAGRSGGASSTRPGWLGTAVVIGAGLVVIRASGSAGREKEKAAPEGAA